MGKVICRAKRLGAEFFAPKRLQTGASYGHLHSMLGNSSASDIGGFKPGVSPVNFCRPIPEMYRFPTHIASFGDK